MGFRNWLTKNVSKTAETVIVQTKESMQKNVEAKVVKKGNAAFTIGKLVLLGVMFIIAGKEATSWQESNASRAPHQDKIPNIIINNYMNERRQNDG